MVCDDPEVIEALRRDFVCVAASDVDYRERADQSKREYRLLVDAFREVGEIRQGHWILSPSGRMLAHSAGLFQYQGPRFVLQAIRDALAAWRRMPRAERLLSPPPDPARDPIEWESDRFARPAGGLDLRVVSRCFPFPGMSRERDTRHPDFFRIDRLWFTADEAASLAPAAATAGATARLEGAALERLVRLHLGTQVQPNPAWRADDVTAAEIVARVVAVRGPRVTIEYSGHVDLSGHAPQNRRAYRGDLRGSAVWDRSTRSFAAFELLAYGLHTLPEDDRHGNDGSRTAPLGVLLTLNPDGEQDRLRPTHWRWGYPADWRRE